MSVTIRPYRKGGWEGDVVVTPDGARRARERRHSPLASKTAALRWAEGRERLLFQLFVNPELDQPKRNRSSFRYRRRCASAARSTLGAFFLDCLNPKLHRQIVPRLRSFEE